jgi:RNA-directed DNA polymerase
MGTASKPPGKATYVASRSDWDWLRNEQQKLYERSRDDLDYVFRKLWGLITDPRNLRVAVARVAANKGRRTAGVDGITVGKALRRGVDDFVEKVRLELRSGAFRPSPARRVLIPKHGKPGAFRPLGIPTVKDRVVQAAMKNILEPIFEADFFPVSYGFRPGKSVHGALEHLRMLLRPKAEPQAQYRLPYQWAIEGDIKGCFDNIDHHALMVRVRRRVNDPKACRLLVAFLKAGVLSEEQFARSDAGTPQGGILSPLLANIALSAIEERYARHAWPRRIPTTRRDAATTDKRAHRARSYDRRHGKPVVYPIRYADDFILLVSAPLGPHQHERAREIALEEKASLAADLKEQLGLELSGDKTLVTPVTEPMTFLGHRVKVRRHPSHQRMVSTAVIPKERSWRLRERIKDLFQHRTVGESLQDRLRRLNPILRGWGNFYRHAWGAKKVFGAIDYYTWWTILRWLRKKHRRVSMRKLQARYRLPQKSGVRATKWRDGDKVLFAMSTIPVEPYRLAWERPPAFVIHRGEPGA